MGPAQTRVPARLRRRCQCSSLGELSAVTLKRGHLAFKHRVLRSSSASSESSLASQNGPPRSWCLRLFVLAATRRWRSSPPPVSARRCSIAGAWLTAGCPRSEASLRIWPPGLDILALPSLRDVITPLVRIVQFVKRVRLRTLLHLIRVALPRIQSIVFFIGLLRSALLLLLAHRNSLRLDECAKGLPRDDTQTRRGRAAKSSSGRRKEPAVYKRRRSEQGKGRGRDGEDISKSPTGPRV